MSLVVILSTFYYLIIFHGGLVKPIPLGLFDQVAVPIIFFGNLESDFVSICKFFLDL